MTAIELLPMRWVTRTLDALFISSQEPVVGSIVFCNLAVALEHTGIYIGHDRIVQLNGDGLVECVDPYNFSRGRFDGRNPGLTIFCAVDRKGRSVGGREIAARARALVGRKCGYNVLFNNCHSFTCYCLTGRRCFCPGFGMLEQRLNRIFGGIHWRASTL